MGWAEHVARIGLMRNMYHISVGKQEGKSSVGTPRSGLKGNLS
jgi:hypothetical protein